jgi:transposase InsO family protein
MTYLPTDITGRWFYLYLILDIYSRKIVCWEVHETNDAEHAAHVIQRAALAEGNAANQTKPVLQGDNGATLKETTVLASEQITSSSKLSQKRNSLIIYG